MTTAKEDITQIRVGQHRMGIIGLKPVLEQVFRRFSGKSDEEVSAELVRRLSKLNYIPQNRHNDYGQAFLREFKRYTGQPYEQNSEAVMEIKVVGGGCPCCDDLEQDLMTVMTEMNIAADIEHVTDTAEIANVDIPGTPALVINGEVKAVGAMPKKAQLKALLTHAAGSYKQMIK